MEIKSQKMKPLLQKDVRLCSNFTYRNLSKKGYRVISKLRVRLDESDNNYRRIYFREEEIEKREKMVKVLKVFKKIKMIKKLDLAEFDISEFKAIFIAKTMVSVSCLKIDGKGMRKLWSKYMKHVKQLNYSVYYRYAERYHYNNDGRRFHYGFGQSSQETRRLAKKGKFYSGSVKYLPRFEMKTIEINFPRGQPHADADLDYLWRFEQYPESMRRICFNGTKFWQKPNGTSMAHLKNLKDLTFEFGYKYNNFRETIESAADLLAQVPQLETLHFDFIANGVIDASICETLKSFTKLKKVRFSLNLEYDDRNLEILECLEYWPLEELYLRVFIRDDASTISGIPNFLSKKKDLKALKLRIINKVGFEDLKFIEDLLQVANNLPQLTSFSFLTMVDTERRRGYSYSDEGLSEINLSFDKLFSRSIPLKKFRISLHQHSFSENAFMKLLSSLKKSSSTLEKLRIDVGEIKPKSVDSDTILDFIKGLHNIRSLKLYSMDISQKKFFLGLSEVIQGLKFLRVFCIGEPPAKMSKASFVGGLKKILVKPGLEKFECEVSESFKERLNKDSSHVLDIAELQQKNPDLKSWPNFSLYSDHFL